MIKNRLKEIRLTMLIEHQTQMAELLGLRQEHYNRYESNRQQPTLEMALKIAAILNIPVEEIFCIVPDKPGQDDM